MKNTTAKEKEDQDKKRSPPKHIMQLMELLRGGWGSFQVGASYEAAPPWGATSAALITLIAVVALVVLVGAGCCWPSLAVAT